jgi:hypothetical protein
MGLFNKLFGKKLQPEDYFTVTLTDELIKVEHPERKPESILWKDIHTILIINTDQGPVLPDVWLTLVGEDSGCMIPQGSKGFEEVYDLVSKYDGFDFENFIKSMSETGNAEYLLWTNKDRTK